MRSLEHENMRFEITSELGDTFLLCDEWALQTLTEEEMTIYRSPSDSDAKTAIFERWVTDQKITRLKVFKDGVLEQDNAS